MTPTRLPRGRHGLSRDEVVGSQRDRILLALAEAMAEKGYVATTVADVLLRAGVSRETFYQQFSSKVDAFAAAFEAAAELLFAQAVAGIAELDGVVPGAGGGGGAAGAAGVAALAPFDRFDAAFTGYLEALASEPAFARVFLVEVYAAGSEAILRRAALQSRIVDVLVDLLDVHTPQARFACEVLVAATGTLVTVPLVAGDLDALRALREPVLDLVRTALATAQP